MYYSVTGNTEEAANIIAQATNGDTFELEPAEAYSSADLNWRDDSSRVVYEHDNPEARKVALVADTVPDWESYDTVFIGYPTWYGDVLMAVYSFLYEYDLSGKKVYLFNTNGGSGPRGAVTVLEELEPGAEVSSNILSIRHSQMDELTGKDVQDWLEDLGF